MTLGSARNRLIATIVILTGATLLLAWRTQIGVGRWGDEPYGLSTALRFVLGDRPLVDSWDTNFSSSILAMPFVSAWLGLTSTTSGILLGFRVVWFTIVLATAGLAYWALRPALGGWLRIAIGVLILLYLPNLSPYVGYGADWSWHLMSVFCAAGLWLRPNTAAPLWILPGVLCGLGIVGNPPTLTVVPFLLGAVWLAGRIDDRGAMRPLLWCAAGVAGVGVVFVVALWSLSNGGFVSGLQYLASADDHDFSVTGQFARVWDARFAVLIPLTVGVGSGVALRQSSSLRTEAMRTGTAMISLLLCGLAFVLGGISLLVLPQSLVFAVAGSLLLMQLIQDPRSFSAAQSLLALPALGAGLGWALGSNGGLFSGMLAAPALFGAALLAWPEPSEEHGSGTAAASIAAAIVAVAIVAAVGLLNTPEGSTLAMQDRIAEGPFRGIMGSSAEAKIHADLYRGLATLPPVNGRTVYFERFPLGYLADGVRAGTYSTWATSATSSRLQEYIDVTGNDPQRMVLTRFGADLGDGQFPEFVNVRDGDRFIEVYSDVNYRVFDRVDPR